MWKQKDKPKRVFLVDPFTVIRQAVAKWIEQTPDLAVCGEADNAAPALEAIGELKPDIVVAEVLKKQDFSFIRTLHKLHPRLPILVFSFQDEERYAPQTLEAGGDGYLMKNVSACSLMQGIRGALDGRVVLSPNMRQQLLVKCLSRQQRPPQARKPQSRIVLNFQHSDDIVFGIQPDTKAA